MTESFSPDDRLSELLDYVHNHTHQRRFLAVGAKPPLQNEPFEHIKYASQALLTGALPNAKTLTFIAYAFDKYINREGSITLDEAFGLKSKPKVGNPSAQFAKQNNMSSKLHDMVWLRARDAKLTIDGAAGLVCKDDPEEQEQATLARNYKRGKWAEYEKLVRGE